MNTNLSPDTLGSARRIASAVARLSTTHVLIEHYREATSTRVRKLRPAAVILAGQGTSWEEYPPGALDGVKAMIRETDRPVLGICGGHQLIALAFGGTVGRIKRLHAGRGYQGCWKESGYRAVRLTSSDPLLGAAGQEVQVFESHYDEVKQVPAVFTVLASNRACPVQAIKHRTRAVYGVQFHPERWDQNRPAGRGILERFIGLSLAQGNRSSM